MKADTTVFLMMPLAERKLSLLRKKTDIKHLVRIA